MISVGRMRTSVPELREASDAEITDLREALYALANLALDARIDLGAVPKDPTAPGCRATPATSPDDAHTDTTQGDVRTARRSQK